MLLLGVFGVAGRSIDELAIELDWIEKHVGNKPYGVDLLLPVKFVGSDKGGLDIKNMDALIPAAHRVFLEQLLEKYGVPPLPPGEKPASAAAPPELQSIAALPQGFSVTAKRG